MTRCRSKDIADIVFFFFSLWSFCSQLPLRERDEEYLPRFPRRSLSPFPARSCYCCCSGRSEEAFQLQSLFFFFFFPTRLGSRATGSFVAVVICFGRAFSFRSVLSSLKRDPLRERSRFLSYSREPRYYNPTTDGKNGVNSLAGIEPKKKKKHQWGGRGKRQIRPPIPIQSHLCYCEIIAPGEEVL